MQPVAQKQTLANSASLMQSAQQLILQFSRNSTDPTELLKLANETNFLNNVLNQIIQAQTISDDAAFEAAISSIKLQTSALTQQANQINSIISDVSIAAQVAGYIVQAASFITML